MMIFALEWYLGHFLWQKSDAELSFPWRQIHDSSPTHTLPQLKSHFASNPISLTLWPVEDCNLIMCLYLEAVRYVFI